MFLYLCLSWDQRGLCTLINYKSSSDWRFEETIVRYQVHQVKYKFTLGMNLKVLNGI